MGFLTKGRALTWEEAQPYNEYVKEHGVEQFIHIFLNKKDYITEDFLWGDEIEYILVKIDYELCETYLNLRGPEIIETLGAEADKEQETKGFAETTWHPEYASYMVEATPGRPYSGFAIGEVEANMALRRKKVTEILKEGEAIITLTAYPRLGAQVGLWKDRKPYPFTFPHYEPGGEFSESKYTPDAIINPHPRFGTLTANIRKRRGKRVCLCVPLMLDENTQPIPNEQHSELTDPLTFTHSSPSRYHMSPVMRARSNSCESSKAVVIHMDSMVFGMGCCCLQTTFQCVDIHQARHLSDQLAILCPYFLAITAACPILKGLLASTDCRWDVISASVDDRNSEERELKETYLARGEKPKSIAKSRYDSISVFISESPLLIDDLHNDVSPEINQAAFKRLVEKGVDERLARHVAHLFIRDPLVIYENRIEIDDAEDADHWENIQSTNWQSVRFKPPPPHSTIGWRVEFRVMEAQLTDFENAAFATYIALLVKMVTYFNLNLYIPLSKVDENMTKAQGQDAVISDSFHFRSQVLPLSDPNYHIFYNTDFPSAKQDHGNAYEQMTANEIINGSKNGPWRGIMSGINAYIDLEQESKIKKNSQEYLQLQKYLSLVKQRAAGEIMTVAKWMRTFVINHPEYRKDSVVTPKISHDLIQECLAVSSGKKKAPTLHGNLI